MYLREASPEDWIHTGQTANERGPLEPAPEVVLSQIMADEVRWAWQRNFEHVVDTNAAIQFHPNPSWARQLVDRAHTVAAPAPDPPEWSDNVSYTVKYLPSGQAYLTDPKGPYWKYDHSNLPWPLILEDAASQLPLTRPRFGDIGSIAVSDAYFHTLLYDRGFYTDEASDKAIDDLARDAHADFPPYAQPGRKNYSKVGYFVIGNDAEFYFSRHGELRMCNQLIQHQPSIGKPITLRRHAHFQRGMLTSLWIDYPNGTLFEADIPIPRYVSGGISLPRQPEDRQRIIDTFLAYIRQGHPVYVNRGLGSRKLRKTKALKWFRDDQERMNARGIQSLYLRRVGAQYVGEMGYRQRCALRHTPNHRKWFSLDDHFWRPNTPLASVEIAELTRLRPDTVRQVELSDVCDFLLSEREE